MDFDFIYDYSNKKHLVNVVGEHGPLGQFLNSELANGGNLVANIQVLIDELENNPVLEKSYIEWNLELDEEDVRIFHHNQVDAGLELEEGNNLLEWQFEVQCGKGDLIALLLSWLDFIEN